MFPVVKGKMKRLLLEEGISIRPPLSELAVYPLYGYGMAVLSKLLLPRPQQHEKREKMRKCPSWFQRNTPNFADTLVSWLCTRLTHIW